MLFAIFWGSIAGSVAYFSVLLIESLLLSYSGINASHFLFLFFPALIEEMSKLFFIHRVSVQQKLFYPILISTPLVFGLAEAFFSLREGRLLSFFMLPLFHLLFVFLGYWTARFILGRKPAAISDWILWLLASTTIHWLFNSFILNNQ